MDKIISGPHVGWPHNPCRLGYPQRFTAGDKSSNGPQSGEWGIQPCRLEDPQHFTTADKIRIGPHMGGLATQPMLSGGSPTLRNGGQGQKWPTNGRMGYITPVCLSVWGPQHFTPGDKIRSGSRSTTTLPNDVAPWDAMVSILPCCHIFKRVCHAF